MGAPLTEAAIRKLREMIISGTDPEGLLAAISGAAARPPAPAEHKWMDAAGAALLPGQAARIAAPDEPRA